MAKKQNITDLTTSPPPHSAEAETAVLGAMMIDKMAIIRCVEFLEPDTFYNHSHKVIYEHIIKLFDNNINVDLITLGESLNKAGKLDQIGGVVYLADIMTKTPTSANAENYAKIIFEKYLKRLLIRVSGEILAGSYDESTDPLEAIDIAGNAIFAIAEKRYHRSYISLKVLAEKAKELIHKIARNSSEINGVPSGFYDLDKLTGGFQKTDLIILAGRPSMGKTALALNIARNVAFGNRPVAFFSIEMSSSQLLFRLISTETKIDNFLIRTGKLTEINLASIDAETEAMKEYPLFIDDSPNLTLLELRTKCRRLKMENKIEIIFIDYLQLLTAPKAESREREIGIVSRTLKQIAKELDIPVVALAQLNRAVEARGDKRPMLSDLRESGSIEQDADVIIFINRPEVYGQKLYLDKTPTENTAELIVAKQRNGGIGILRLLYLKDRTMFANLDNRYRQAPVTSYYERHDDDEPPF